MGNTVVEPLTTISSGSLRLSGQKAGQGQKGSQDNAFHLHELRFFGL